MKRKDKIEYLGKWHAGHIALFGAILMSKGIVGKEKEKLKKMMYQALMSDNKPKPPKRDSYYEKHPELCS